MEEIELFTGDFTVEEVEPSFEGYCALLDYIMEQIMKGEM